MSLSFKRNYSGFSPKDFGPALWLDDTGSDASVWTDKSGNGRDATQVAVGARPQIVGNVLNGKQVRRFTGGQYLDSADWYASDISIFSVAKTTSTNTTQYILGKYFGTSNNREYLFGLSNANKLRFLKNSSGSSTADNQIIDSAFSVGSVFNVLSCLKNGVSATLSTNREQELSAFGTATVYNGTAPWRVGAQGVSTEVFDSFTGDIAEIIIYPRALTQFERQVVEGYLSVKWGIPVSSSLAPSIRIGQSFDSDASAYFSRIVSAGSSITRENMVAIDQFIRGCKADGIWNAIKASCLLCGADTLAGALVPLVGPAPTNIGFVEGDYSRTTGLKGNVSKLLDSNRNNNEDPQNSHHLAAWVTQVDTTTVGIPGLIGTGGSGDGDSGIIYSTSGLNYVFRSRHVTPIFGSSVPRTTGLHAISRYSANNVAVLLAGFTSPVSRTSQTPRSSTIKVFGRDGGPYWNGRVSFYSIGENINLTALNNRLSILMASLT